MLPLRMGGGGGDSGNDVILQGHGTPGRTASHQAVLRMRRYDFHLGLQWAKKQNLSPCAALAICDVRVRSAGRA